MGLFEKKKKYALQKLREAFATNSPFCVTWNTVPLWYDKTSGKPPQTIYFLGKNKQVSSFRFPVIKEYTPVFTEHDYTYTVFSLAELSAIETIKIRYNAKRLPKDLKALLSMEVLESI